MCCAIYEGTRRVFIIYRARFLANSFFFSSSTREEFQAYKRTSGKFENNISKKLHNKTLITDDLSLNDIWTILRFVSHESGGMSYFYGFSLSLCELANQNLICASQKITCQLCHKSTRNECKGNNVAFTMSKERDDVIWFVFVNVKWISPFRT